MLFKLIRSTLVLVMLLVLLPNVTHAQVSSIINSIDIEAIVIPPISIENTDDTALDFGTISRSSASGTVTVPITGTSRMSSGGVAIVGSSFSRAPFSVTGENNATFNITLPANGAVLLHSGSESIAVNEFKSSFGETTPQLSNLGSIAFEVGATLSVGANQFVGIYDGTFSVTVAYQ